MMEELKRKIEENDKQVGIVVHQLRKFMEQTQIPLDTNSASACIGIGVTVFRYYGYSDKEIAEILLETLKVTAK